MSRAVGMPPRVLCAPDKLRDALDAVEAAEAMARGAAAAGWSPVTFPIADGGEGTLDVLLAHQEGRVLEVAAQDPLGRPVTTRIGFVPDGTALIVAADVIGLEPLAPAERDPLRASSGGIAAPVLAAVAAGCDRVVVFVGGTANMDGGLGLLAGLGAVARDADGARLRGCGADLAALADLDLAPARAALAGVELIVASDVTSPLTGPEGAAAVFGPQKGASPDQVAVLDRGLGRLADLLGLDPVTPGAGAGGGLGLALLALGAARTAGADLVLELSGFDAALRDVDLCITAEGKVDRGSSAGKAVGAVLAACRTAGVPCVVLGGTVTRDADALYDLGAAAVLGIGREPRSLEDALRSAAADLSAATRAVCGLACLRRR